MPPDYLLTAIPAPTGRVFRASQHRLFKRPSDLAGGRPHPLHLPLPVYHPQGERNSQQNTRYGILMLMTTKLKELLERAETWPDNAQEEAVASLEAIEAELAGEAGLSTDDRKALEASADDVRHGRFATQSEVQGVFGRYRRV